MSGDTPGDPGGPVDPADFEHLPSTDIEVDLHVHFGMTGSFPLQIAELFFAEDGLHIATYSYITPMFGLGTKKHRREASSMQSVYDVHGLDEVLLQADSVLWLGYGNLDRVVVYDGGWLGRPKIAVYSRRGPSEAYRLHDEVEFIALVDDLEAVGERRGFAVEERHGLGFVPRENLLRFFGRERPVERDAPDDEE